MTAPFDSAALNNYLDNLISESRQATRDLDKNLEEDLRFFRGDQWTNRIPRHRIPFTANYIGVTVKRITGLMTDTKPTIDVKARKKGLEKLASELIAPAIRANWDEQSYHQKFANGVLPIAQIFGRCPVNICYDSSLDGGLGDITIEPIDPRSFFLDPTITRAVDLDKAEYAGFRTVMPLRLIRKLFPDRGHLVQPNSNVSRFLDETPETSGWLSPGHRYSRTGAGRSRESFAVPRAVVDEFWIADDRLVRELPKELQEMAFMNGLAPGDLAFPGGRRIVRAGANKVLLLDMANPYLDQKFPFEMFDWDIEIENPLGSSVVKLLKSLQTILNKLGSQITENAIKMNNNIWIGDRDALERHEWQQLNDAPGLMVRVKPGRMLKRESPPALPGSVFQMIQWVVNTMDVLTGMVDVTQGRRPVGIVSSHAIEALQIAAQVLIRLQTRKFENFLERIGQKLISRVFQFYTSDRLMHFLGPGNQLQEFFFERQRLLDTRVPQPDGSTRPIDLARDLKDLRFIVTPGSSMAVTRIQKGQIAMQLYQAGLLPGVEVLKALEWEAPEEMVQQARAEAAAGAAQSPQPTKRLRVAA